MRDWAQCTQPSNQVGGSMSKPLDVSYPPRDIHQYPITSLSMVTTARHIRITQWSPTSSSLSCACVSFLWPTLQQLTMNVILQLFWICLRHYHICQDQDLPLRYRIRPGKSVNKYEILGHIVIGLSGIHASFKPVFNSWISCWQSVA